MQHVLLFVLEILFRCCFSQLRCNRLITNGCIGRWRWISFRKCRVGQRYELSGPTTYTQRIMLEGRCSIQLSYGRNRCLECARFSGTWEEGNAVGNCNSPPLLALSFLSQRPSSASRSLRPPVSQLMSQQARLSASTLLCSPSILFLAFVHKRTAAGVWKVRPVDSLAASCGLLFGVSFVGLERFGWCWLSVVL